MSARALWTVIVVAVVGLTTLGCGDKQAKAIALFDEGDTKAAGEIFQKLHDKDMNDPIPLYYLGRVAFEEERYRSAVGMLGSAVKRDPENAGYHHWLGRAAGLQARETEPSNLIVLMDLASKIKGSFQKTVELEPDNLEARSDLFQFYIEAPNIVGGNPAKALEQAEYVAERDSELGLPLKATALMRLKKYEDAAAVYQEALEADATAVWAQYGLAQALQESDETEKARAAYEATLKLDPEHKGAQKALEEN